MLYLSFRRKMRYLLPNKVLIIAIILAAIAKTIGFFPYFIEHYYTPYCYQPLAKLLRILFGWIPFSVGDVLYVAISLYLIFNIFVFGKKLWKKTITRESLKKATLRNITLLLFVYSIFSLVWGVQYNRLGIAYQLKMENNKITKDQLKQLFEQYVTNINLVADSIKNETLFTFPKVQDDVLTAYQNLSFKNSLIQYKRQSIKYCVFGKGLSYMGLQGYYNPFTGEAQINNDIPAFLLPNVVLHEMAHQIGYAKEDEANFVGYLAAMQSTNPYIKYSYYMDVLMYAASELKGLDSVYHKQTMQQLHPKVKAHFAAFIAYRKAHTSIMEDISTWFYNHYLQINDSSKGIYSYNEVLRLLVGYHKKYQ